MIGDIIQQKRKAIGLTQSQLADRLGVSAPAVNRWEKNLSFPDVTLLAPLARCLKTDLNELFSFYNALSEKERELIVSEARTLLFEGKSDQALSIISATVKENLSDGQLYIQLADMLYGMHTFYENKDPLIFLDLVAEYYERALVLLPEHTEKISYSLTTIYGKLGKKKQAEEAWNRLPQKRYDKQWIHAELHYLLKDYDLAIPEIKELTLRKVVDLYQSLTFLRNALTVSGDEKLSDLADEMASCFLDTFGLWRGFDVISRATAALEAPSSNTDEVQLSDLITADVTEDKLTTCPLFEGVQLGGHSEEDSTIADTVADLLSTMQRQLEL